MVNLTGQLPWGETVQGLIDAIEAFARGFGAIRRVVEAWIPPLWTALTGSPPSHEVVAFISGLVVFGPVAWFFWSRLRWTGLRFLIAMMAVITMYYSPEWGSSLANALRGAIG